MGNQSGGEKGVGTDIRAAAADYEHVRVVEAFLRRSRMVHVCGCVWVRLVRGRWVE